MKKKALFTSFVTIALCLSLIAGSTFALFTSGDTLNVAITAAKVEMKANISELALASVRPATVAEQNAGVGIVEDEFGGLYVYEDRVDTFANGGTAVLTGNTLTLDKVTPGDKVSFDINGFNSSDVTVQYRYIIECTGDQKLMSGLLVTIEGVTYEFLGSYTSTWMTLQPDNDPDDKDFTVPVVIEFPVDKGNEFQQKTTDIKVTVEAVQGNADVADNTVPMFEYLNGISVDMDGDSASMVGIVNDSSLNLSNGTIEVDYVGFQNYGNATLNDVTIKGGTSGTVAYGYALNSYAGSTVLNDVTVNSNNGGIGVTGGQLIFNDGYVEVDAKSTSARYLFYVVGEGTVVVINDGEFFFNKTQNQKRAYAYVGEGATLLINGGNFGTASSRAGYTAGLLGEGTIIITGGTFGFDPTAWVADGCKVVKNGTTWTVVPVDAADIKDALANGKDVVLGDDVFVSDNYASSGYGKTGINVNGQTVDGNGNAIGVNAWGTWDSAVNITGGTIKNLTINSGMRGIFVNHNGAAGKVYLENVIIDGTVYTISCDQGSNSGLEAKNSTFNGWTSYAATIGDVLFTDCSFGEGQGYAFCRPYAPTTFVGCDFEAGYEMDARAAVTFENCTIGGQPLTAANLATLVISNIGNATVK